MIYDLIGTMYTPTGVILTDSDGLEYPETEIVADANGKPYYHVNMLEVTEATQPYVIQVNTPSRKFAGRDDTVHLKFANRDEWLSLGIETIEDIL